MSLKWERNVPNDWYHPAGVGKFETQPAYVLNLKEGIRAHLHIRPSAMEKSVVHISKRSGITHMWHGISPFMELREYAAGEGVSTEDEVMERALEMVRDKLSSRLAYYSRQVDIYRRIFQDWQQSAEHIRSGLEALGSQKEEVDEDE